MGTRGLVEVIVDGEMRVAQYGQWDFYPEGEGVNGLEFVHELVNDGRVEEFKEKVRRIEYLPEHSNIPEGHEPAFSRDTGVGILDFILDGMPGPDKRPVEFLFLDKEFRYDELFCEGIVTINLDEETYSFTAWGFETTHPFDNLPNEDDFVSLYQGK